MPEQVAPVPALRIVADLHLEVGDDRGRTGGHLSSGPGGLVLDVDDPAVLLRSVPGRGFVRDLPVRVPPELTAGTSVRLRSRGRELGLVRLSTAGRIRFTPTVAGVLVAARTAVSYGGTRRLALTGTAVAAAAVVVLARRRRR